MTQAYYFTKQNVDFEKFSDVTKDVLFNEFLKNEKYSNIINPFFNKIKDEFISTYNNIKDIQLYIPNENLFKFNYEDNKFSFHNTSSYCRVKSSFFYNELLAQLSSQSPFKFFSQKELETGLSNSYSLSLAETIRNTNSGLINNIDDLKIIIKAPLLNNICNLVNKSDSLCAFFKYDRNSNNLNLLQSNILQYIENKAKNISFDKINVIEKHLQENINKETLDFFNKNIYLTFNNIMLNIIDCKNNSDKDLESFYNYVYDDLCTNAKSSSSNDDYNIYTYEQYDNEFISSNELGCKTSTQFIREWCVNLDLPLEPSRFFPNIIIDQRDPDNSKIFPTCQEAQDFILDFMEPWLDDNNKILDREPDRLYDKAKQYLELNSKLNEKTLSDLKQSYNKVKGISTNQSQLKEAEKTKTAGFHL